MMGHSYFSSSAKAEAKRMVIRINLNIFLIRFSIKWVVFKAEISRVKNLTSSRFLLIVKFISIN